MICLFD